MTPMPPGRGYVLSSQFSPRRFLYRADVCPLALRDLEVGRVQVVVDTIPVLRYTWRAACRPQTVQSNLMASDMSSDGFLKSLESKWIGTS